MSKPQAVPLPPRTFSITRGFIERGPDDYHTTVVRVVEVKAPHLSAALAAADACQAEHNTKAGRPGGVEFHPKAIW